MVSRFWIKVTLVLTISCGHSVLGDPAGGARKGGPTTRPSARNTAPGQINVSSSQARDIARKAIEGGKIYQLKLARTGTRPTYYVHVKTTHNHLQCVMINARTGKVIQIENDGLIFGSWSFDDDIVGQPPDKWIIRQNHPTKAMATWGVASASDAPSPPNILNVQSDNENATFNMALAEGTSFRNIDLRVQIHANSGKIDQGGGLIWRAKDQNNYYVCRINPLESNYRVYKVEDGKRHQLKSADVKTYAGKWHSLRVVMVDDQITCYLDDQEQLELKDSTFNTAGTIGLWTKADASSSFDDVIVLQAGVRGPPTAPAK